MKAEFDKKLMSIRAFSTSNLRPIFISA